MKELEWNIGRYYDAVVYDDWDAQVDDHVEEAAGGGGVAWERGATQCQEGAEDRSPEGSLRD